MDSDLRAVGQDMPERSDFPVFLLYEKNPLIASDMKGAIEALGACDLIHVTDAEMIVDALMHTPRLTAAFLEMSLPDLVGSEIETALDARGAAVVLTQGENHQAAVVMRGWHMLIRPFTDQMLWDLVKDMRGHHSATDPDAG